MVPVLAFDIESIPDTAGLTKLYDLPAETPADQVAEIAFQRRRKTAGSDFLQHALHRVLVISCALRSDEGFRVWSLSGEDEAVNIQRFFDGIEKYTPQLVTWNGGGFDLPVLNYRALVHGLSAPRFWDTGEDDREFKWNNYISRYHTRHLDLMDVLAMYQPRANTGLDDMAKLIGFPGKLGMDGSQVWPAYQRGEVAAISNYCETDAVNTYLVYLRFQLLRGHLTAAHYQQECTLVREQLGSLDQAHWREFVAAWPELV